MNGITELAKAIVGAPQGQRSSEEIATVVRRGADGTYWVHIAGGADETPVSTCMVEASEGDTVRVAISGGRAAITGNMSTPSSTVRTVTKVGGIANMALTTAYSESARIDRLSSTMVTADSALIRDIQADTAKVHSLSANQLAASTAYIAALGAGQVAASDIIADHAALAEIDVDQIAADHAAIANLDTDYAHVTDGLIDNAEIGYAHVRGLAANYAQIEDLEAGYAKVDLANVDQAVIGDEWVDRLMVQTHLIAHTGEVFILDALQVNAASITAGTIDVERIVVTNPETGAKTLMTWDPDADAFVQAYLDGNVLAENSIAADRIVANSITADQITAENIRGTHGWINLSEGEFEYMNIGETEGISWKDGRLTIVGEALSIYARQSDLDEVDESLNGENGLIGRVDELQAHVRIEARGSAPVIVLDAAGGQQGGMSAELSNTALSFLDEGDVVAQVSNKKLTITDTEMSTAHVSENLSIGNFSWIPMSDGSLAFKWMEMQA